MSNLHSLPLFSPFIPFVYPFFIRDSTVLHVFSTMLGLSYPIPLSRITYTFVFIVRPLHIPAICCSLFVWLIFMYVITHFMSGTVQKPLLGGPWCKKGPFPGKFLTLVRGALKISTNFPVKIEFTCFLWGWPVIFMEKRGDDTFWGLKGGGRKIFAIFSFFFFCISPSLQVFVNGPLEAN